MRESIIQEQIVNYLSSISAAYGFVFFSVPNEAALYGGREGTGKQFARLAILKKMGMRPGASDLVLGWHGKMYCLEVKNESGEQSTDQLLFEAWCLRAGAPYVIVRGVDDVMYWLREWGIVT
jgi:hypothetical protein